MTGLVEAVCVAFADIPQPRKLPFIAIDKRRLEGKDIERLALLSDEPTLSEDSRLRLDRALNRAARR